MKKILLAIFVLATASSYSYAKFDPKECYKRCMDETGDKSQCEYICYKKEK